MASANGTGTAEDPWILKTPPGTSEYTMWRDEQADPPTLVCQVGSTKLSYQQGVATDCGPPKVALQRGPGDVGQLFAQTK